jgi:hypothetical protein
MWHEWEKTETHPKFCGRDLNEIKHLKDLGIDGRLIQVLAE